MKEERREGVSDPDDPTRQAIGEDDAVDFDPIRTVRIPAFKEVNDFQMETIFNKTTDQDFKPGEMVDVFNPINAIKTINKFNETIKVVEPIRQEAPEDLPRANNNI